MNVDSSDSKLRSVLEANGLRFTEQRAAVYRFLAATEIHPTADEVLSAVREGMPAISLATVYKSLETLVGCGLAMRLTYADQSARYDGRTDPHHHARCVACDTVTDIPGEFPVGQVEDLKRNARGFTVTGYRFEVTGYCPDCLPGGTSVPAEA